MDAVEFTLRCSQTKKWFAVEASADEGLGTFYRKVAGIIGKEEGDFKLEVEGAVVPHQDTEGTVGDTCLTAGCEVNVVPTDVAAAAAAARRELMVHGYTLEQFEVQRAVQCDDMHALQLFLVAGMQLQPPQKTRLLCAAALRGKEDTLRQVLHWGVNPDIGNLGMTALQAAAIGGHPTCIEVLLAHGAHPHCVPRMGLLPPLHLAAARGHKGCIDVLLRAGAVPGCHAADGRTALVCAAEHGFRGGSCVDLLLAYGAQPWETDWQGLTVVHLAAAADNVECLQSLLLGDRRKYINVCDPSQRTPLHLAAAHDASKAVNYLLGCGADPALEDSRHRTPLQTARYVHSTACAGLLARKG